IPKGNLLVIALGIVLAASRANLGMAAATILLVSFAAPWLDPASDAVGTWLLGHPSLQNLWTDLYNRPVMPWTSFYNTIVLGSFAIGLMLWYPAYRLSRPIFERVSPKVAAWTQRFRITRFLLGAEMAGAIRSADGM
ncbi:MAG: TIGR03546 family protein, partial [Planctomycetaceae bacterium]|nr:TIGR03546 family protein [Planctomycetaceae bacterium]